jgi:DNA mismatch repair ATPase MutS
MDILFAENSKRNVIELKPETVKDLALQDIIETIAGHESNVTIVRDILTRIPEDLADIHFRQEIMKDFLNNDSLVEEMDEALGEIRTLKDYAGLKTLSTPESGGTLYSLLENLRELSVYVNVSEDLVSCLKKCKLQSTGLKNLLEKLDKVVSDENFEKAKEDIKKMLDDLSCVRGAIVGVNFSPDLNVQEVSAVEFVPYRVRSKYLFAEFARFVRNVNSTAMATNSVGSPMIQSLPVDPLLVPLAPMIDKHLRKHFVRLKGVLSDYVQLDSSSVIEMYEGLLFYITMAKFAKRLKLMDCDICIPQLPKIAEDGRQNRDVDRTFSIKGLYNVRLVFAGENNIVKNDFDFSPKENLFILTGPNRGGKTIIEQAIGIISIMAASGAFVTASECKGRPFANILTHFPIDENLTINYGRLGEEAVRVKEIVRDSDDRTLILFNETYSTTSAADGFYLSQDLLRILKEKGTATIFNTHIHEVARAIDEMNQWDGESDFVSIIMEIKDNVNTFHVKRSAPDSKSYARNIAEKYGITYEQMRDEEANKG